MYCFLVLMYFDDKKMESGSTEDFSNSDVASILYVIYILIA